MTPVLSFDKKEIADTIGKAYDNAIKNLIEINSVPYDDGEYNRTGLLADPPSLFIRAGGDYQTHWTRDASINSWNAASLLIPDTARNTLWAVCEKQGDGKLIVQRDEQWGPVSLTGLKYRSITLNIRLEGSGKTVRKFVLDGVETDRPFLPAGLSGVHDMEITLTD